MVDQRASVGRHRALLAGVVALACGLATTASAEVRVEGDVNALRVTASDDTVSDVLSTIRNRLHVKYSATVPLDGEISGTYSGSLSQVVSRLLDGYLYVIKSDQDSTEIIVFGRRGEIAVPPGAPTAKGPLSRWQ
jgi:hypothetical protein